MNWYENTRCNPGKQDEICSAVVDFLFIFFFFFWTKLQMVVKHFEREPEVKEGRWCAAFSLDCVRREKGRVD